MAKIRQQFSHRNSIVWQIEHEFPVIVDGSSDSHGVTWDQAPSPLSIYPLKCCLKTLKQSFKRRMANISRGIKTSLSGVYFCHKRKISIEILIILPLSNPVFTLGALWENE